MVEHFQVFDHCGYEVAIIMLLYFTNLGKIHKDCLQYNTIQQYQYLYGNQVKTTLQITFDTLVLLGKKERYKRFGNDMYGSMLFHTC